MTDPRKDDHLEEDLKVLSASYRAAADAVPGAMEPPTALDEAIRAAARRAVNAGPRPVVRTWFSRSSTPLAAAAVLVLTVSIGFLSLDDPKVQVKSKLDDLGMAQPSSQSSKGQDQAKSPAPAADQAAAPAEPKYNMVQGRIEAASPSVVPPPPPPKPELRSAERAKPEAVPGVVAQVPVPPPPASYVPAPPAPPAPAASPRAPEPAASTAPPSYEPPPAALTRAPVAAPAPVAPPVPVIEATPTPPPAQPSDASGRKRADTTVGIRGLSAEDLQARSEKPTTVARAANRPDYEAVIIQSQPAKPSAPAEPKREGSVPALAPAPASIPQSVGEVRVARQKEQQLAKQFAADPPSGGAAARAPAQASATAVTGNRVRSDDARAKKEAFASEAAKRQSEAERAGADTAARDRVAMEKPAEKVAGTAAESEAALTADEWIKRILELRKQGKTKEAADELQKFKKRYPDYSLPPELRDAR